MSFYEVKKEERSRIEKAKDKLKKLGIERVSYIFESTKEKRVEKKCYNCKNLYDNCKLNKKEKYCKDFEKWTDKKYNISYLMSLHSLRVCKKCGRLVSVVDFDECEEMCYICSEKTIIL